MILLYKTYRSCDIGKNLPMAMRSSQKIQKVLNQQNKRSKIHFYHKLVITRFLCDMIIHFIRHDDREM